MRVRSCLQLFKFTLRLSEETDKKPTKLIWTGKLQRFKKISLSEFLEREQSQSGIISLDSRTIRQDNNTVVTMFHEILEFA